MCIHIIKKTAIKLSPVIFHQQNFPSSFLFFRFSWIIDLDEHANEISIAKIHSVVSIIFMNKHLYIKSYK